MSRTVGPLGAAASEIERLADRGRQVIWLACEPCGRRGRYRCDRLLAEFGNVPVPQVMDLVAQRAGCARALNPPSVNDIEYNLKKCQIRSVGPTMKVPPTLATALHGKWRLFLTCERHHQGLKRIEPCPGEQEIDVPSLVAAFGHAIELDVLKRKMTAPCCGTDSFSLRWEKTG